MRWWSIPLLAALAWLAYTLTPFWSLYGLARAVQAGDVAGVEQRVNFRTLRLSLARQVSATIRAEAAAEPRERQRLTDAAAALALPVAEALVTPQTVVDLLDDGWPQALDLPDATLRHERRDGLRIPDLSRALRYYLASDMRGFRSVVIPVPPDRPRAEQFRLRLRLHDWGWRIVEIELSEDLRGRIAEKIAAGVARLREKSGQEKQGHDKAAPEPAPPWGR
ncbi:hypothetical protein ASG52_14180 [Methylobacterium sp. Leaf456]|uniref:DUF2939 domain-containing protein n=1 Tax=Methylobacterium sp. Leaf456 TaxID=1736382 RepID=UPI0006FEE844|nr:DUF2939 domain-containing protein [Methylobacterium sp. Leaf456]KQT45319.1 hypothetical protein ASG52_14180 [Methylobacterium sp. Leaf456]